MVIKINNKKIALLLVACLVSVGTMVATIGHGDATALISNKNKIGFGELEDEVKRQEISLPVDLYADKKNIVVVMDVPGVDANNIKVNVTHNRLHVSGKREEKEEVRKGKTYFSREIKRGKFDYDIALQYPVDASAMSTNLSNGVLTIILPKQ